MSNEPISNLRQVNTFLTGHDPTTGNAIFQDKRPAKWQPIDNNAMAFNVIYTTSEFPVVLTNDADIAQHNRVVESGQLGLVNKGGNVTRMVDFAPNNRSFMHRTQSLDIAVLIEGTIELELDNGEKQILQRGDTVVQRGTIHAWNNPSATEWARMLFVLQDSTPVVVRQERLREELGLVDGLIPPSRNDE